MAAFQDKPFPPSLLPHCPDAASPLFPCPGWQSGSSAPQIDLQSPLCPNQSQTRGHPTSDHHPSTPTTLSSCTLLQWLHKAAQTHLHLPMQCSPCPHSSQSHLSLWCSIPAFQNRSRAARKGVCDHRVRWGPWCGKNRHGAGLHWWYRCSLSRSRTRGALDPAWPLSPLPSQCSSVG